MPTIACPDCGHAVSPAASACPGCGSPITGRKPGATAGRHAVLVLLAILVGFVLAGLANYLTYGNVAVVAVAFLGPVAAALALASRAG